MLEAVAHAPSSIHKLICELQVRTIEEVSLSKWENMIDWTALQEGIVRFDDLRMLRFLVRLSNKTPGKSLDAFCQGLNDIAARRIPVLYQAGKIDVEISTQR